MSLECNFNGQNSVSIFHISAMTAWGWTAGFYVGVKTRLCGLENQTFRCFGRTLHMPEFKDDCFAGVPLTIWV